MNETVVCYLTAAVCVLVSLLPGAVVCVLWCRSLSRRLSRMELDRDQWREVAFGANVAVNALRQQLLATSDLDVDDLEDLTGG